MNAPAPNDLQQHLAEADAVIAGTVTGVTLPEQEVRRLTAAAEGVGRPVTEHDPDWREATIQVGSVEKGDVPQQTTVLFPASMDVAWYRAPKLHAGQKGVFVLHQRDVPELDRSGLVALHPDDYHPPEQLSSIRSLMRGGG
jgi:hypothetical protein